MPVEGSFLGWEDILRFGTVAAVVWSAAWFLNSRFDALKTAFLDKLEYHERHDDSRFESIRKDLIELRVNLARIITKASKFNENGSI